MVNQFVAWVMLTVVHLNSTSACGTSTLTADPSPKYLTSPSYPSYYQHQYSCSYTITANAAYSDVVIQIQVLNASLEPATGCWRDSVEIIDGSRDFMRSLTSFCGNTWPTSIITSTGSTVLVLFNTDFTNNDYYGFMLTYWIAKKPLYVVNETPWSTVNYCLLAVSVLLLLVLLIALSVMIFLQIVRPRYHMWQKEKVRRDSIIN